MKRWLILKGFRISPYGHESVTDHFSKMERALDIAISLYILNLLAEGRRLETIPKIVTKKFELRLLTNPALKPDLSIPNVLPKNQNVWPVHIKQFYDHLTSASSSLHDAITHFTSTNRSPAISTRNVYDRGTSSLRSGYLRQIRVGPLPGDTNIFVCIAKVCASMRLETHKCAIFMIPGQPLLNYACSCVNG